MSETLTFAELQEITEYTNVASIRKWLHKNHIPFLVSKGGKPVVNRLAFRQALGVILDKEPEQEPNWNDLK